MRAPALVLVLTFAHVGILWVMLGFPLWKRRVAPNKWYGFRLRSTLESEALWYAVNAAAGRDLVLSGGGLAVLMIGLAFTQVSELWLAGLGGGWLSASVLATILHAQRVTALHRRERQ